MTEVFIDLDDELLSKAIQQFGFDKQELVAVEEMAELQKEILKSVNRGQNNRDHLKEELVDVLIMLRQLVLIYDFIPEDLNKIAAGKMEKLKGYLK